MDTKLMAHQLGHLNELRVATELTGYGCEVFMPIGSQTKADMVFILDGKAIKVQVKTATEQITNGCLFNQCRLDNSAGKKYKDGDFDLLVVALKSGQLLAYTWDEVRHKSSLCVGNRNPGMSIETYLKTLTNKEATWLSHRSLK